MVKEKSNPLLALKKIAAEVGYALSAGNQITPEDIKVFEHVARFKGIRPAHLHLRLAFDVPGLIEELFGAQIAPVPVEDEPVVAAAAPQPEVVVPAPAQAPQPEVVVPPPQPAAEPEVVVPPPAEQPAEQPAPGADADIPNEAP